LKSYFFIPISFPETNKKKGESYAEAKIIKPVVEDEMKNKRKNK